MPRTLAPIPLFQPIVDRDGKITQYFRLRWEQLTDGFPQTPAVGSSALLTGQHASIGTTIVFTTTSQGFYRISYYMRKTTADGVSSSLTFTGGWLDHGVSLTQAFAALTTDTTSAQQNGSIVVYADAASDLTFAVTYASNTPGTMIYQIGVLAEQLV